jgi:hypothetical protein
MLNKPDPETVDRIMRRLTELNDTMQEVRTQVTITCDAVTRFFDDLRSADEADEAEKGEETGSPPARWVEADDTSYLLHDSANAEMLKRGMADFNRSKADKTV